MAKPKQLALFPMTKDMCAIARCASLLQGYSLSHALVPRFMYLSGRDISVIDGGNHAGIPLLDYEPEVLNQCHVLFVDYDENISSLALYEGIIESAKNSGIDVLISRKLAGRLESLPEAWPSEPPRAENPLLDKMYDITVPVLTVLSHGPRADQLAVELTVRKHFIEAGYKVSQIGLHEAGALMGFSGLPDFMFEPRDAYEKTVAFNHFVKNLVGLEQPDLLIMAIPGGVMKYNNRHLNGLGYLPYIACNAVQSDLIVLSVYHAEYYESFFENLSRYGEYHLGTPIQFFNIANTVFVPEFNEGTKTVKYIDLTSAFVLESVQNLAPKECTLFNILDDDSAKNACEAMVENLSGNVSSIRG